MPTSGDIKRWVLLEGFSNDEFSEIYGGHRVGALTGVHTVDHVVNEASVERVRREIEK